MRPGEEIRLVKENLAFAVAFWKAAAAGNVPPAPLLRPGPEPPLFNQPPAGFRHLESELAAELTRGAANQMRAAFALSALQVQRSLADAFPGEPIEEEWPELRAARSAMYLIGLAVQQSILQPVWECPPRYQRVFQIRRIGFILNAMGIKGRTLSWDDFGGLESYLSLLEYCAASAAVAEEAGPGGASRTLPSLPRPPEVEFGGIIGIGAPGAIAAHGPGAAPRLTPLTGYPGEPAPRRLAPDAPPFVPSRPADSDNGANGRVDEAVEPPAQPSGSDASVSANGSPPGAVPDFSGNHIDRFIAERCETGAGRRMLAGELYTGFLEWCSDAGQSPMSQRAFGMRLTSLGLVRKRRGHGKHWWEGIRLAG